MDTGFSNIIDRISGILDFFDFSFIVSGLLTYGIILYTADSMISVNFQNYNLGMIVVVSIVLAYICGLVSFSIGKSLKNVINKKYFNNVFKETLDFVNSEPYQNSDNITEYSKMNERYYKTIYSKMWMELRYCEDAKETIRYINRFWMMEAVYEGLFVSFILGAISSIYFLVFVDDSCHSFCLIALALSLIAMVFSFIEARKCAKAQIVEIVLTYKKFIAV